MSRKIGIGTYASKVEVIRYFKLDENKFNILKNRGLIEIKDIMGTDMCLIKGVIK